MNKQDIHPTNGDILMRVIREDLHNARFESRGAKFAIEDGDDSRAYNHAKCSARLALRAMRRFEAFTS